MLMADYTPQEGAGGLRGFAQFDADGLADALKDNGDLTSLLGDKGHMAFTVDQGADMERYQGIVPLEGANLADAALGYFDRSEQIGTAINWRPPPCFCPAAKPNGEPVALWCNKWRPVVALLILKRRLKGTLTILMMIGTGWKFYWRPRNRANYWTLM